MTAPAAPPKRPIHTLGPGSLVINAPGGGSVALDISCQISNLVISAKGDSEDPTPTLCGGAVAGARTYAWTMAGAVFQDVQADGLIDWTWRNAGAETGFTFIPDTTGQAKVTGTVMVDPVGLGGDVKKRNTSEFEWNISGDPVFTAQPATGGTTPAS
ncbi:hypothetical protein [Rhodococcus sp. NPDC006774]|uniref:hypothetical protein n=1 Tax=Rhodococcus sp. NPDC006774 TaxID=3157186 RepID=UPI0033E2CC87